MKPGWHIITYQNIDHENSLLTRAVGGTVRPDMFRHHVQMLARMGRFISIPEGRAMLDSGRDFTEPVLSLWFDDGFRGVRTHALPICREHGIRAAMSVCSRFVLRTEMSWRAKLSFLAHVGALGRLRARLGLARDQQSACLRTWTLHHFGAELIRIIDELYRQCSHEPFRRDAFRIFDDQAGLRALADAGWLICNHTAAHYPLAARLGWNAVRAQFQECDDLVIPYSSALRRYWVVPFGQGSACYRAQLTRAATVVEGGERHNTVSTWRATGRLFRYSAPATRDIRGWLR